MSSEKTRKVRLRVFRDGGMSGGGMFARVVQAPASGDLPEGAVVVPDETPVSDWRHETPEEAAEAGKAGG